MDNLFSLLPNQDDCEFVFIHYKSGLINQIISDCFSLSQDLKEKQVWPEVQESSFRIYNLINELCFDDELLSNYKDNLKSQEKLFIDKRVRIFKNLKSLEIRNTIVDLLEYIVLLENQSLYALYVKKIYKESIDSLLLESGLSKYIVTVVKEDIRGRYLKLPLICLMPKRWVHDLFLLPPTHKIIFAQPSLISLSKDLPITFTSSAGTSIQLSDSVEYIEREILYLESEYLSPEIDGSEFIIDKSELNNKDFIIKSDEIQFYDSHGSINTINAFKKYIFVNSDGKARIDFLTSEKELSKYKYVILDVDYSGLDESDWKRVRYSLMRKWKDRLRVEFVNDSNNRVANALISLGSKIACDRNIKRWINEESIAPRDKADFKAVLNFVGITNDEEINYYQNIAESERSKSIKLGHHKAKMVNELILDSIENNEDSGFVLKNGECSISGVKFKLAKVASNENDT